MRRRILAGRGRRRRRRPPDRRLLLERLFRSVAASGVAAGVPPRPPVTVRLGYLANITHAPALIAVKNGYFTKDLGWRAR